MKKKINVIDLDKTLIPYDSFRVLVKKEIFKFNLRIILFTKLRILRIISLEKYKGYIIPLIEKKYDDSFFKEFALSLYRDMDSLVLKEVQKETDNNTINILLSASPDFYVKHLIEELKWQGKGSYFDNSDKFLHLYGSSKISWVKGNYDESEFEYNMAISDSSTDDKLLTLFQRKIKWTLP